MTHIFVSYKRENHERVNAIVRELKRHHYIWFDQTGIPGGSDWEAQINRALDEAAALILMVTPAALESEWVQYEYQTALKKGVPVIPYLLDDSTLPADLRGRQALDATAANAFETLMDALPNRSRIWGDTVIATDELRAERTFGELAALCPDAHLQPTANLVGIPIHQTRYCRVYLVGKRNDTLEAPEQFQLALQLTSRNFSLKRAADGSYPQDEFAQDIASHTLTSPSKRMHMYLVQGPLNQPYDEQSRLGFGLNVQRESEWLDVVQAADYARGIAKASIMQLFVNGPAIMTYRLGTSNPGFYRYELYQRDYSDSGLLYQCVLCG